MSTESGGTVSGLAAGAVALVAIAALFFVPLIVVRQERSSFEVGDAVEVPDPVSGRVVGDVVSVDGSRVTVKVFEYPEYVEKTFHAREVTGGYH